MKQKNHRRKKKDAQPNQSPSQKKTDGNENIKAAHEQADADIEQDPDFSMHSPNDDLDEGETARLGEDKTDLV